MDGVLHRRPDVAEDGCQYQTEEAGCDRHKAFAAEEAQEVRQFDARPAVIHGAAAVKLDVDKTGGKDCTINRALFDTGWQLCLRTDTFDKAIGDNNRMVIQNFMTGINPALG